MRYTKMTTERVLAQAVVSMTLQLRADASKVITYVSPVCFSQPWSPDGQSMGMGVITSCVRGSEKQSSDHDPIIRHFRMIGIFRPLN